MDSGPWEIVCGRHPDRRLDAAGFPGPGRRPAFAEEYGIREHPSHQYPSAD